MTSLPPKGLFKLDPNVVLGASVKKAVKVDFPGQLVLMLWNSPHDAGRPSTNLCLVTTKLANSPKFVSNMECATPCPQPNPHVRALQPQVKVLTQGPHHIYHKVVQSPGNM